MKTVYIYTSPARGHLFPVLPIALELKRRQYHVCISCLADEVAQVTSLGLDARPLDPRVEAREMDDWRGKNPLEALERAMRTFADRARPEVDDVRVAIEEVSPDVLLVDTNSWGAQAVAESSGLPWATFQPYFTALPGRGIPPFGPGFRRSSGLFARIRDAVFGKMIFSKMAAAGLSKLNDVRTALGVAPLASIPDLLGRPPLVLYLTSPAFEYPRDEWPENYRFVGPISWTSADPSPAWLDQLDDPIALVTCSSERQDDRTIISAAPETLPDHGYSAVATTAAYDPADLAVPASSRVRVERFVPHHHVVARSRVVVCHGGMGITQRALSHGVPVVVVPYGRDQLEVARRVEHAGVGVMLKPSSLNAKALSGAVRRAREMTENAVRLARSFAEAGGPSSAADAIADLVDAPVVVR
jgi:MGT family glycosyltransferase